MTRSASNVEGLAGLIAPGSELCLRASGVATWSEGPVWIANRGQSGRLRWSDIPGNRILELDNTSGEVSVYATEVEFTNGRTLAADGSVVQCSHGRRGIEQDTNGVVATLVDHWQGHRLNSPNDVITARDGSIWFTDPPYGIIQPHEGHPGIREYGGNYVFRFDPVSGELHPVATDLDEPNGLAFSPDEAILYVSDTSAALREGNHHIRAYDLVDGQAVNSRVFIEVSPGLPDGFRVDVSGRIWTSSADSVQVFSPGGTFLGKIPVPEKVGNLCFGGVDGTELFIAASTSIYSICTTTRCAEAGPAEAGTRS